MTITMTTAYIRKFIPVFINDTDCFAQQHLVEIRSALRADIYKEPLRGTLNRPPQPSLREGIPALLRRGMGSVDLS